MAAATNLHDKGKPGHTLGCFPPPPSLPISSLKELTQLFQQIQQTFPE